jgi:hypothetical protein
MDSSNNITPPPDLSNIFTPIDVLLDILPPIPTSITNRQIPMNRVLPIDPGLDNRINEEYLIFFRNLFSNETVSQLSNFTNSNFTNSNFTNSNFTNSNFTNSNFTNGTSESNINSILNMSLNDPHQNIYKNVINETGEAVIKTMKYNKDDFEDQEMCIITLNSFNEGDDIAKLPCGHIFNKVGILKWLKTEDARCPICRTELPSIQVNKNIEDVPISLITSPITSPVTSPITSPVTSPITSPVTSPITSPVTSPITSPVTSPITSPVTPQLTPPPPLINMRRLTNSQIINSFINLRLQREEEQDIQDAIMASLRD